jgi:hypothetical protein
MLRSVRGNSWRGETMATKKLDHRVHAASCGCGAHQKSRKALAVDPEIKS